MVLQAYVPALYKSLGVFLALIVVNLSLIHIWALLAARAAAGAGAGAPQPHLCRAKARRAQRVICHALPDIIRHFARRGFVCDLPDAVINYHFIRFGSCRKEHYHDCYP